MAVKIEINIEEEETTMRLRVNEFVGGETASEKGLAKEIMNLIDEYVNRLPKKEEKHD